MLNGAALPSSVRVGPDGSGVGLAIGGSKAWFISNKGVASLVTVAVTNAEVAADGSVLAVNGTVIRRYTSGLTQLDSSFAAVTMPAPPNALAQLGPSLFITTGDVANPALSTAQLAKIGASGERDKLFGTNGVTASLPGLLQRNTIISTADGRLYAGGTGSNGGFVARYWL